MEREGEGEREGKEDQIEGGKGEDQGWKGMAS